ncbi:MAG: DUF2797 domain-containing protein [Luteibaculaceae bacterium]
MEKQTYRGHLRKMRTHLENEQAQYTLKLFDNLEPKEEIHVNSWVGKTLTIRFTGSINCIETGKSINKTYGEGLSYDAFTTSANAVESIIRPELSKAHLGIALRDWAWERDHDLQPHYVYLSKTSEAKVGVTRGFNLQSRWIDQGAVEGIILAETPYRQAAGAIEVACKAFLSDKTNWRNMLTNAITMPKSLSEVKQEIESNIPYDYAVFVSKENNLTTINYPVLQYPSKVNSFKLETKNMHTGKLTGIKGQYFLFEDGSVINIRTHAGYEAIFELEA